MERGSHKDMNRGNLRFWEGEHAWSYNQLRKKKKNGKPSWGVGKKQVFGTNKNGDTLEIEFL